MNKLFGVNIAGADFGESNDSGTLPGTLGSTYIYSTNPAEYKYYVSKGLTLFRIPFMWERVQNAAFGPLSTADTEGITSILDAIHAAGGKAILDMHNYARYYNVPLIAGDTSLANVWTQLVPLYMNHPAIYGYELNNEPHDLVGNGATWASIAQTVVNAIRTIDKTNYVIVSGYQWQGAVGWANLNPNFPINDIANKILYSAHVYFDGDGSGGYWWGTPSDSDGTGKVTGSGNFIDWLQKNNQLGIVTEYGVPFGPGATSPLTTQWFPVLDDFLNTLNTSPYIVGGTAWAGGPWWGNYNLTIEPSDAPATFNDDRPSMAIYTKYPSTKVTTSVPTPVPTSGTTTGTTTTTTSGTTPAPTTTVGATIPEFSLTGNIDIESDGKGNVTITYKG